MILGQERGREMVGLVNLVGTSVRNGKIVCREESKQSQLRFLRPIGDLQDQPNWHLQCQMSVITRGQDALRQVCLLQQRILCGKVVLAQPAPQHVTRCLLGSMDRRQLRSCDFGTLVYALLYDD